MRKGILGLALTFLCLCLLISCSEDGYGHAELVIPLPDTYEAFETESFDAAYTDGKSTAAILRISFEAAYKSGIPDSFMPDEFAAFYMNEVDIDCQISDGGDFAYCEYTVEQKGIEYSYLASFFRSKYAYFIVVFTTDSISYQNEKSAFLEYADGVAFLK